MGRVALLCCAAALAACGGGSGGGGGGVTPPPIIDGGDGGVVPTTQVTLAIGAGGALEGTVRVPGGTVHVALGSSPAVAVSAGSSDAFTITVGSTVTLTATANAGWAFARWTLSGGLSCESPPASGTQCDLDTGSAVAGATVEAVFEAVTTTLTVAADGLGEVAIEINEAVMDAVAANSSQGLAFSVLSAATLTATADSGHRFARWMLSGGLACAGGAQANPCVLPIGSLTANVSVDAVFIILRALTVSAGTGGSVAAAIEGGGAVAVDTEQDFTVSALSTATLTATAASGYRFADWTLSGGLACADGTASNICALPLDSLSADVTVSAAFEAIPTTLTVVADGNGSVVPEINDVAMTAVVANSSQGLAFSVLSSATLTAIAASDHHLARWTLSPDGTACAGGRQANPCVLPVGSVTTDTTVEAVFELVPSTLTVIAEANGSVNAGIGGAPAEMVAAGSPRGFTVNVRSTATLTAVPDDFYRFERWKLSVGLTCESGRLSNPCVLPTDQFRADATVRVVFKVIPNTLTVAAGANGAVFIRALKIGANSSQSFAFSVEDTASLEAIPVNGYRFGGWTLSPDGLACESGPPANFCVLPIDSVRSDARVSASFLVPRTLTVVADSGGSVAAKIDGVDVGSVRPLFSRRFAARQASMTTLTATANDGWAFDRWTLSGPSGLACESGARVNPCVLAAESLTADARVQAGFRIIRTTLTVAAGVNGEVVARVHSRAVTVRAGLSSNFTVDIQSEATLSADPATGYRFARWTLSGLSGVACESGTASNICRLQPAGLGTDNERVEAIFVVLSALTVTAGANGSVAAEIDAADAVTVATEQDFAVSVLSSATLTATADAGWAFADWTVVAGALPCAGGAQANPCVLPLDSLNADTTVSAAFEAVPTTLTVVADGNGSVVPEIDGVAMTEVAANSSRGLTFSVESSATLTAAADAEHRFARWTLSGGLACKLGTQANICELPVGSVSADATVDAVFVIQTALTVIAGVNGSVAAKVGGDSVVTVNAGSPHDFITVTDMSSATLTATANPGWALASWTVAGDELPCAGGTQANPCVLPTGSLSAGAVVSAVFGLGPAAAWSGPGSVSASAPGGRVTHTAVPFAPGTFENWNGAPCNGSTQPECDFSSLMAGASLPAAVFRPFVVDGIKSLAFGLGYHGADPDHFRVSFQDASDAGFTPVPSLERLMPGPELARLSVSVHLLRWSQGSYLTEACDAPDSCAMAIGGEQRALEQADSVAATGYFKAPNAAADDQFGWDLALSGDGATLAAGAVGDDSASTGTFAPDDEDYQDALDSDGAVDSGAVTVYRRSDADGLWTLEAFVKAPVADVGDRFGTALALSRDGSTLAVGAPEEDSASTGTFALDDDRYQAALDSDGAVNSGAVTVYRRSDADSLWTLKAFVKAPVADVGDRFGTALALSRDGSTLAVGAVGEDSSHTATFAPDDDRYQAALDSNDDEGRDDSLRNPDIESVDDSRDSGAVTVYRRSDTNRWEVEAFIKAPKTGGSDGFGQALALSRDGSTLAVSAPFESSASTGTFVSGGTGYQTALDSNDARGSGAVTVYRRSGSAWRVEAFVKPSFIDPSPDFIFDYDAREDNFGRALALSADGSTLAVGAPFESSAFTGAFAPGAPGYQAALASNDSDESGAVTVYRRSNTNRWAIEAFVKAPKADAGDSFGLALALSSDGATLAVGAPFEDSRRTGTFAPGDTDYTAALDSNASFRNVPGKESGAVIVYRRLDTNAWKIEAFVKAPVEGRNDNFSTALALSEDGTTLAAGAPSEDGGALSRPVGGGSADTGNAVKDSGAVYLY